MPKNDDRLYRRLMGVCKCYLFNELTIYQIFLSRDQSIESQLPPGPTLSVTNRKIIILSMHPGEMLQGAD